MAPKTTPTLLIGLADMVNGLSVSQELATLRFMRNRLYGLICAAPVVLDSKSE
jgi:hypothetical protein